MSWNDGIWAIIPTLCVGLIFWFVMRGIFHADRNERAAMAKVEAEESAAWARELAARERRLPPTSAGN